MHIIIKMPKFSGPPPKFFRTPPQIFCTHLSFFRGVPPPNSPLFKKLCACINTLFYTVFSSTTLVCTTSGTAVVRSGPAGRPPGSTSPTPTEYSFTGVQLTYDPPGDPRPGPPGTFLVLHRYTSTYVKVVQTQEKWERGFRFHGPCVFKALKNSCPLPPQAGHRGKSRAERQNFFGYLCPKIRTYEANLLNLATFCGPRIWRPRVP